jgi:hypothetical protein
MHKGVMFLIFAALAFFLIEHWDSSAQGSAYAIGLFLIVADIIFCISIILNISALVSEYRIIILLILSICASTLAITIPKYKLNHEITWILVFVDLAFLIYIFLFTLGFYKSDDKEIKSVLLFISIILGMLIGISFHSNMLDTIIKFYPGPDDFLTNRNIIHSNETIIEIEQKIRYLTKYFLILSPGILSIFKLSYLFAFIVVLKKKMSGKKVVQMNQEEVD